MNLMKFFSGISTLPYGCLNDQKFNTAAKPNYTQTGFPLTPSLKSMLLIDWRRQNVDWMKLFTRTPDFDGLYGRI